MDSKFGCLQWAMGDHGMFLMEVLNKNWIPLEWGEMNAKLWTTRWRILPLPHAKKHSWVENTRNRTKKKMKNSIPVIVVSVFFIGWVIWFLFWRNRFSDRTWNRCKWIVSLELSWNVSQQPSYYDCYWTKLTKEFQQLKPSCNCQHLIRFTAYPHTAASLMLWRTF